MQEADIELYLIRHAESVMNTMQDQIIGGRSNETPLTSKGIVQAKRLGAFMLREGIIPDLIFASPAVRTLQTASYSIGSMGISVEPVVNDDIQELDQGLWVGRNRTEIYTPAVLAEIARLGKDFKGDGGESMNEVGERMFQALVGSLEDYVLPKVPERRAVFTHGVAIRCLLSHLFDWGQPQTYMTETGNTSITLLSRRQGEWELDYVGRMPE